MRLSGSIATTIDEREYARLLGYPPRHGLSDEARSRAREAIAWYARSGDPSAAVARLDDVELSEGSAVRLAGGIELRSAALVRKLRAAGAYAVAVAALTAGSRVDEELARLWEDGRVDEAYFLDRLAAAVVEHLRSCIVSGLHYSPGYDGWALEEQAKLMEIVRPLEPAVTLLPSGMLKPKSSVLALYGLSRRRVSEKASCSECSWLRCRFRRAA